MHDPEYRAVRTGFFRRDQKDNLNNVFCAILYGVRPSFNIQNSPTYTICTVVVLFPLPNQANHHPPFLSFSLTNVERVVLSPCCVRRELPPRRHPNWQLAWGSLSRAQTARGHYRPGCCCHKGGAVQCSGIGRGLGRPRKGVEMREVFDQKKRKDFGKISWVFRNWKLF